MRKLVRLFVRRVNPDRGQLPRFWSLAKDSLRDYWTNRRSLVGVTLAAALPLGFLSLLSEDPGIRVYGSFAAIIMNLALVWVIVRTQKGYIVGVKEAYYDGTAAMVRFLLVALVLVLQLLPFVVGATIFSAAVTDVTVSVGLPERLLVGLLWLILAIPTARWATKYCFALLLVSQPGVTPLQALRSSKQRVQGKSWKVFGRLTSLVAMSVLLIFIPTAIFYLFLPGTLLLIGLAVLQLLVTVTVLPVFYLFLYRLYKGLA